ncbi:MAG: hypothetical protein N2257_04500 [Thermodesulfovibrionales bacterium]|nr:hypothetical protein [Thermodesulfovibrionales bacterium]
MAVKELTDLSLTDLWREYQRSFKDFWQLSDEGIKGMRVRLLEEALKAEQLEYIGCFEYERSAGRMDYRIFTAVISQLNEHWRII